MALWRFQAIRLEAEVGVSLTLEEGARPRNKCNYCKCSEVNQILANPPY